MWLLQVCVLALALMGCGDDEEYDEYENPVDETIILTVENRSGYELWFFQYRACGSSGVWTEVIGDTEFVPDGADVSSVSIAPGCYDLYVEDERACTSTHSTDGNLAGGLQFFWTVKASDLDCF